MHRFDIPAMSCGHCTAAIESRIKAADAGAQVSCDLTSQSAEVDSQLSPEALLTAIQMAGYAAPLR